MHYIQYSIPHCCAQHPRREEPPESEDPLPVGDAEGGAPDAPPAADAPAANQEGAGAEAEEEAEAQPNANEQPSNTLGTITEESARR